jgi:fructosamine-3-kinase
MLYSKLDSLIPHEVPALIHGDLWSGNYLVGEDGLPVLIDPAVYYGHREMDLGMMKLFGGFDQEVFDHYHANFPLENGWRDRIPLNQLYPLLVHVNLFGLGYVSQVSSALKRFV